MTRSSQCLVMFAALTLSACGPGEVTEPPPPDWMLGEFSGTNIEGYVTSAVERLEIRSDGVARFYATYSCSHVSEGTEVPWEMHGDDAILVWLHGVGDPDYFRIEFDDCNTISVHTISNGEDFSSFDMYRGMMCLKERSCEGIECDPCETIWCEGGAPASCE
jgi:hypothetical protein